MFSTSNNLGRVTKQTYEDGDTVTYRYDNSGALATVEDSATGRKTTYYYDFTDRLMKYVETGTNYYHSVGYEYDQLNNLTALVETINGTDYTTSYVYDDDNRVASVTTNGTTVEYTYDTYGRISQQVTKRGDTTILTETYTYAGTGTTTSGQIATYKTETANYSVTYSYTYDDNGNILSVNDGTYATSHVYDSANQLIRENNQRRNRSYTWAYDNAGNVLSQKAYVYTTGDITESTATAATNTYTYGDENWGDLLTAYNGTAITYDEIGNPDGYGGRTFTWEHGRQMATQTRNGVTWSYTYDANGMRTKRSSASTTYEYVYSGDKLLQMTVTDHTTSPETVQLMEFSYDAAGQPLTMTLDGVIYYYVLNIQGDVMGMVDGDGNLLYTMVYEGYGAGYYFSGGTAAATMLLNTNPLGYRGYVKDAGTGLYYLQSRYYDPTMGRFLNADTYMATGSGMKGNNMFAYCLNNPVNMDDSNGKDAIYVVDINGEDGTPGLPVVGHARVYIQDADGNWYMTEYIGEGLKFWTARPYCTPVKGSEYEAELISILLGSQIENTEYVYLSGDFSKSYEKAMAYAKSKLGYGIYNLLVNNCLHYAIDILSAGDCDISAVEIVTSFSPTFIPRVFYYELIVANSLDLFPVPGLNRPKNRHFTTVEVY